MLNHKMNQHLSPNCISDCVLFNLGVYNIIQGETLIKQHCKANYTNSCLCDILNHLIKFISKQLPTIVILTNIPYPPLFLTMYYYSCMYCFIVYFHSCPSSISFAQLLNAHLGTCISYIRLILTTLFLASFIVIIHVSAMQLLCIACYDYG